MARLTWQNVEAPSTAGVAQSLGIAGNLFGSGAKGISDALGGMSDRKIAATSQGAMANLLQFKDTASFDRAMSEVGLAGVLGVDPSMVNSETMKSAEGYRATLLGNENTVADTAKVYNDMKLDTARTESGIKLNDATIAQTYNNINLDNNADLRDQEQHGLNMDVGNFNFGVVKADRAAAESVTARTNEGTQIGADILRNSGSKSTEELKASLQYNPAVKDDPVKLRAAEKAIDENGASANLVPQLAQNAINSLPEVRRIDGAVDDYNTKLARARGADPARQLYIDNAESWPKNNSATAGVALKSILDTYNTSVQGDQSAEAASAADTGLLADTFKTLTEEYKTVPADVIAKLMISNFMSGDILGNLRPGTMILGNREGIQPDLSNIRKTLDQLNNPQNITAYDREKAAWRIQDTLAKELTGQITAAKEALGKAVVRGDQAEIQKQQYLLDKVLNVRWAQFVNKNNPLPNLAPPSQSGSVGGPIIPQQSNAQTAFPASLLPSWMLGTP